MRSGTRAALVGFAALGLGTTTVSVAVPAPASSGADSEGRIVSSGLLVNTGGAKATTMDPDGTSVSALDVPGILEDFNKSTWSHDGTQVMYSNTVILDDQGNLVAFRPAVSDADGSGFRVLRMRWRPVDFYCSAWSPDDSRLLCHNHRGDIVSIRVRDGRGTQQLTANPYGGLDVPIGYSPDGTTLAWLRERPDPRPGDGVDGERYALYVADADGTNARRVTRWGLLHAHELAGANWSPDGTSVVSATRQGRLVEIDVVSGEVRPVPVHLRDSDFAVMPDYSPDGLQVVFAMFRDAPTDLFVANLDGSGLDRITHTKNRAELSPDWH